MPKFSSASQNNLETVHPDLQRVLVEAIKYYDFTILEGHRGKEAQNDAYNRGVSNAQWPQSKHNSTPAKAVDLAPFPVNWSNTREFFYLAGVVLTCAKQLGVPIRWGGRWRTLVDLPHFEL